MSDQSQGPGWWLATDGRWYPPQALPLHARGQGAEAGNGAGPAVSSTGTTVATPVITAATRHAGEIIDYEQPGGGRKRLALFVAALAMVAGSAVVLGTVVGSSGHHNLNVATGAVSTATAPSTTAPAAAGAAGGELNAPANPTAEAAAAQAAALAAQLAANGPNLSPTVPTTRPATTAKTAGAATTRTSVRSTTSAPGTTSTASPSSSPKPVPAATQPIVPATSTSVAPATTAAPPAPACSAAMTNPSPALTGGSDSVIIHSNQAGRAGTVVVNGPGGSSTYAFVTGGNGSATVPVNVSNQRIGTPSDVTVRVATASCGTTFTPGLL